MKTRLYVSHLLTAATLAAATFSSATAHAQSAPPTVPVNAPVTTNTRARLNNAASAVAEIKTPAPNTLAGAARHAKIREIGEAVDMARAQVNMVTRADRTSRPVVDMLAYLDKLDAYKKELEASHKAATQQAAAGKDKTRKFLAKHLGLKDDIVVGLRLQRDPDSKESYIASKSSLERLDAALKAIEADCKGEFAGVADDTLQNEIQYKASLWCGAAANREAVIARGLANAFHARAKYHADNLDRATKRLTPIGDGFIQDFGLVGPALFWGDDLEVRERDKFKQEFGVDAPPGTFDAIKESATALRAHVEAAAPTFKSPGGAKAKIPAIAGQLGNRAAEWGKKLKVKGISGITDWSIRRTATGRPIDRQRNGYVLYQVANEKFCRLEKWLQVEDAAGKGWRLKKYELRDLVRIQACK